tara:strand:+ start:23669 stop:25285 length:1617 start_codon:yes stop_codon:yes gene_type:complete
MNIESIELRNFMSYDEVTINFPQNGIVLVTGPNGSGKSTLIEAIAFACWGKTLRGTSPWRPNTAGSVTITTREGFKITRSTTAGSRAKLSWEPAPAKYATTKKAQDGLSASIGTFDVWKKCAVFSSQDASHFTMSTDAERKRLLENLLGLDSFDAALKKCKAEKRTLEHEFSEVERNIKFNQRMLKKYKDLLSDTKDAIKLAKQDINEDISQVTIDEAENLIRQCELKLNKLQKTFASLRELSGQQVTQIAVNRKKLKLLSKDSCPTCEQQITKEFAAPIEKQLHDELEQLTNDQGAVAVKIDKVRTKIQKINEAVSTERRALSSKLETLGRKKEAANAKEHFMDTLKNTKNDILEVKNELNSDTATLETLEYDVTIMKLAEQTLGLKGIRAHILGNALNGLQILSNQWLKRISSNNMSLEVCSYKEKKTGGVSDAISIHVHGAGGGYGYKASSGGQRRRIDVAMLLALAELAQGSNQYAAGTVFFDEVFDSLDWEGIHAVSDALSEMSQDKIVFVISHSADVSNLLDVCLHIDAGNL